METKYRMGEAAKETEIPDIGRNKLYRILKTLSIVDHLNRPKQVYIDAGLLARPQLCSNTFEWNIRSNVTLVVGNAGLEFIKRTAKEYLTNNPMPTFPHKKRPQMSELYMYDQHTQPKSIKTLIDRGIGVTGIHNTEKSYD